MLIVTDKISLAELKKMSEKMFGDLVKVVVDVDRKIMVVNAGLHADQEQLLLENDSAQENLWGIIFPEKIGTAGFIVFDSMINLRPSWGNKTRGVDDPMIREKIKKIVQQLVAS